MLILCAFEVVLCMVFTYDITGVNQRCVLRIICVIINKNSDLTIASSVLFFDMNNQYRLSDIVTRTTTFYQTGKRFGFRMNLSKEDLNNIMNLIIRIQFTHRDYMKLI